MTTLNLSDRYSLDYLGSTLKLSFPYSKSWLEIVSYPFEAAACVLICYVLIKDIIEGKIIPGEQSVAIEFLIFGLFFVAAIACLIELLWQLAGREVVELNERGLALRHHIFGAGISNRLPPEQVCCFRVSEKRASWFQPKLRFFDFSLGAVEIGTRGEEVRFGSILQTVEADQVARALQSWVEMHTPAKKA
ncbi:MAG: hypothetical protein EHM70_02385 [Chloroflexota bacterium]|nr:MAG: hypothetical protein EHM70_02385 [Chloroflexota bacterium]